MPASLPFTAALAAAACAVTITTAVGHGALRPLLEARGITPWTLRDTLGALPLVVIGSGSATAAVVGAATRHALERRAIGAADMLCLALLATGAAMVRLGLLALRKLTEP